MINPFEHHPENLKRISKLIACDSIKVDKLKSIINLHLEKIKKEKTPIWGYNNDHINLFFNDLVADIENEIRKKDDC